MRVKTFVGTRVPEGVHDGQFAFGSENLSQQMEMHRKQEPCATCTRSWIR
jgi:hypothetical protein